MRKFTRFGFIMLFITMCLSTLHVQADNSKFGYYEYDFSGGSETYYEMAVPDNMGSMTMEGGKGTIVEKPSSEASTFSIIGEDDRTLITNTLVSPVRWIGSLICNWPDGSQTTGTAWLYGPDVAVTAGHCIYRKDINSYPESMVFMPGYDRGAKPYGNCSVKKALVTKQWKNDTDSRFDAGILKLSTAYGKQLGYFSIQYDENVNAYLNKSVWLTGYDNSYLFRMKGKISNCTAFNLYYQIDTSNQDGAPIFFTDPNDSSKRICIGFHTSDSSGMNMGVRICKVMFNWMSQHRDSWT